VLAAGLYLGAALLLAVRRGPIVANERGALAVSALIGGVAGPVLLIAGLRTVDAATASLLLALQPVFTAAIAWAGVGEHASRRTVAGFAAIAAGGALLAWHGSLHASAGALLVAGAALAWAIDDNVARRLGGSDALAVAGMKGLGAGMVSALLALVLHEPLPVPAAFAGALAIGLVGYGISVAWFVAAQRDLGTARTAAYFGAAPLIGAAAALAFGTRPDPPTFAIAGALVAAGIGLHATERHIHAHRHDRLAHEHEHEHDAHHRHAHDPGIDPVVPHRHVHRHEPLAHAHPHAPDLHHRHAHHHH
jgi:drug/metabolite transporter (DMT)-like permease